MPPPVSPSPTVNFQTATALPWAQTQVRGLLQGRFGSEFEKQRELAGRESLAARTYVCSRTYELARLS